jgi:preprotein translocase subunit SecG
MRGWRTYISHFDAVKFFSALLFLSGTEIIVVQVPDHPVLEIISSLSQMIFGTVVPFVLILGCNIIIIVTVKEASKERAQMSSAMGQGQEKRKEEQHLTRMLVFVSIAYVVTSIPYRLFAVFLEIPSVQEMYNMDDVYWNLRYQVEPFPGLMFGFITTQSISTCTVLVAVRNTEETR